MADIFANFAYAKLTANIDSTRTSFPVDSVVHIPLATTLAGGEFWMTVESTLGAGQFEIIRVTGVDTAAGTLTVLRAQQGTVARFHSAGAVIKHAITADVLARLRDDSTISAGLPAITSRLDGALHYNIDNRFAYVLGTMDGIRTWQPILGNEVQLEGFITGVASVGTNKLPPGLRVPHATTVREVAMEVGTVPVGGPLTVEVRRKSDNALLATPSIAAGATSVLVAAVNVAIPEHDRVIFNVTAVGPTTAGADIAVALECR